MNYLTKEIHVHRSITAMDQGKIITVPFLLPSNVISIEAEWHGIIDKAYTIDLGLLDPNRVRGWSGGARTSVHVGLHMATPGYLAGPLKEGQWAVLLGLYKVPTQSMVIDVDVRYQIYQPQWLKGDLHVHTNHSDGIWSIDETLSRLEVAGMDFAAFTDHNTSSQNYAAHIPSPMIIIQGMEYTTSHGHANIYGVADPLPDWRTDDAADQARHFVEVRQQGGQISINHPFDNRNPGVRWDWDMNQDTWVELWNGPWRSSNQEALDWWQVQLREGHRRIAIGGSDTHNPHSARKHGLPTTWVYSETPTAQGILSGIQQGHVFLTESPTSPTLMMRSNFATIGDEIARGQPIHIEITSLEPSDMIQIITENGTVSTHTATTATWTTELPLLARKFVRVEVLRQGLEAGNWNPILISNPMFFSP